MYADIPFNYSWIGHAANLTCVAMGEPEPIIKWYITKNEHPFLEYQEILPLEGRYKIQGDRRRSNLEVHPTMETDFRNYRCNATNKHGKNSTILKLRQAEKPG